MTPDSTATTSHGTASTQLPDEFSGAWSESADEKEGRPVNYWAVFGAICIVFQIGVFVAWIAAGDADSTPTGPTAVPDGIRVAATIQVVILLAVAAALAGWFVVKPLVTERRLTIDGMFLLGFLTVGWQVVLPNYNQLYMSFNADYFNLGSWGPWIPGWLPPNGHEIAVPLLWLLGVAITVGFGGILVANQLMRAARRRWPRIGMVGLLGLTFAFLFVAALVLEFVFLRSGVYAYGGGYQDFSLFAGHHYQLPIYQPALAAFVWTGFAAMRFFVNEKGEVLPHRGLDRVNGGNVQRGAIRVVAIAGMMNVLFFLGWSLPTAALAVHADEFPVDLLERSYLVSGLCGPNTEYHCPGPDIPIPRPDSDFVTPEGDLGRKN